MQASLDFLVFAPNPWQDLWRNRQQIFSRLAERHRVLYVEPARASLRDWRQGLIGAGDVRRPIVIQEGPNLQLWRSPVWLPIRGTGGRFDSASDSVLAWHLRRTMAQLGFAGQGGSEEDSTAPVAGGKSQMPEQILPLLWLYRPVKWRWARANFPHSLLVYHVTDDYTAFGHLTPAQREATAAAERELLAAADLTIVTSARLMLLKSAEAKRIELVPNAVDYPAFQRVLTDSRPPAGMQGIPYPRLGYSGHVSSRLDLSLLRQVGLARPEWQLVFAGSQWDSDCTEALAALKALPNVHFLGQLPVEKVPRFIAACDVCLIPYRVNDETRAISSLKLYEYLAAGRPVVSAAVPAAEEHGDVVLIAAANGQSWIDAIDRALATVDDPDLIAARRQIAAANTWDDRVEQIEEIVAEAIESLE
ncbi:MAG: glycosyltransferase [Chloroflexota bacterium]|nr:glycosyltransferase [Chloroflexota bacterium]